MLYRPASAAIIAAAQKLEAEQQDHMIRYAIELSNVNAAPVQLYLDAGAGCLNLYEIPACCQALREQFFAGDLDFPLDGPP